jgi:hypothetical protein
VRSIVKPSKLEPQQYLRCKLQTSMIFAHQLINNFSV